jgi:O-antigen ligase
MIRSLVSATAKVTPAGWPRSPLAHNDYLQAFAEGGLLLGLPFLAACVLIGIGLLRVLRSRVHRRAFDVRTGLAVGALALMAHAAVDFDWTYPALLILFAVVAALAIAPVLRRPEQAGSLPRRDEWPHSDRRGFALRAALVGLLVVATIVGGLAAHVGGLRLGYHTAAGQQASGSKTSEAAGR